MKKRLIDGIEIEDSSGNVFADLDLPQADRLKIKSGLVIEITQAIRKLGLTQAEAAHRMGITQPKVSGMMRGDFTHLSEHKRLVMVRSVLIAVANMLPLPGISELLVDLTRRGLIEHLARERGAGRGARAGPQRARSLRAQDPPA